MIVVSVILTMTALALASVVVLVAWDRIHDHLHH
jgi:hypothetical protein